MKLFLDDVRIPRNCLEYMYTRIGKDNTWYAYNDWTIVKNYNEFTQAVQKAHNEGIEITHASFDHDLADEHYDSWDDVEQMHIHPTPLVTLQEAADELISKGYKEKTGYDCAVFLKEMYEREGKALPKIFIHTMNPAGRVNLNQLFNLNQ